MAPTLSNSKPAREDSSTPLKLLKTPTFCADAPPALLCICAKRRRGRRTVPKALLLIAAEEHKHFQILENVCAFANAPSQFLAWGEFSNLEEFRNFGRKVGH